VLVVDDNQANLAAVQALLEGMCCDVVLASSGDAALRQLLRRDFAVVLLDVQMPGMDGYEVSRLVRDNPATRDVPIIFLTASNESKHTALRAYGSGAVDVLFKPIDPTFVRSKVAVFIELWNNRHELEAAKACLQRSNRELEAFSYSVSHDLRAPLRSIDGFSQAIIESHASGLGVEGLDYLHRVRNAAQRMTHLIDDLLMLSRVGRQGLNRTRVNLTELATAVAAELRQKQPARTVKLSVQEDVALSADRGLLRIVLENLLGNAWKFTSKTEHPSIEVGATDSEGELTCWVKDNGAGFNMAHSSRLFAPFQRLHSDADFPGTGIGLATVHRIIERHGGRVWARAEVGQGATVFFSVPSPSQVAVVHVSPSAESVRPRTQA
jgi:signal transduction histidine kinase